MNFYALEWQDNDGSIKCKEAQYIADLFDLIKELLGTGVNNITVIKLKKGSTINKGYTNA